MSTRIVDLLLEKGSLRLEPRGRKAYIDPLIWTSMNAEVKERAIRAIATYCLPMYPEVDLYDAQSARRLASYGPLHGFKVY